MAPAPDEPTYVSVKTTRAARESLRALAVRVTSPVGRQLSLSEVLIAAVAVSTAHEDELVRELQGKSR